VCDTDQSGRERLYHFDFVSQERREVAFEDVGGSAMKGHGGGDFFLMSSFVDAVAQRLNGTRATLPTNVRETLQSHLVVFAAERARLENRVVDIE